MYKLVSVVKGFVYNLEKKVIVEWSGKLVVDVLIMYCDAQYLINEINKKFDINIK